MSSYKKCKLGKQFGITIKANHIKNPTEADYKLVLKNLKDRAIFFDFVWEDKKKDGTPTKLHFHGVITFSKIPLITNLVPKGFHVHYKEIYDISGWEYYMNKNTGEVTNYNDSPERNSPKIDNNQYMF